MGKSIRLKRLRRLRGIKRKIVEPHYDAKDLAKMAVQEAAMAAPKVDILRRHQAPNDHEDVSPQQPGGKSTIVAMSVDSGNASSGFKSKLKPTREISKKGRKTRKDLANKRKKILGL